MLGAYCWLLLTWGWTAFPQFPPHWFKVMAGVGQFQAIWPQPWHLKHWRELESLLLAVPWCLALVSWLLPLISTYCSPCPMACRCPGVWCSLSNTGPAIMGAGAAWSTPVCPLLPWPLSLGLFGALAGLLPCPALVRVAISFAICCPSSVVPSLE